MSSRYRQLKEQEDNTSILAPNHSLNTPHEPSKEPNYKLICLNSPGCDIDSSSRICKELQREIDLFTKAIKKNKQAAEKLQKTPLVSLAKNSQEKTNMYLTLLESMKSLKLQENEIFQNYVRKFYLERDKFNTEYRREMFCYLIWILECLRSSLEKYK